MSQALSIPAAIERLFGVRLADHEELRNSLNTLTMALGKAGLLALQKTPISHTVGGRSRREIYDDELTVLHNAVVLHGVFASPKLVCELLQNPVKCQQHAGWARELLLGRQSVAGLGMIRPELLRFLDQLTLPDFNLQNCKLANPFEILPQMGLGHYDGNLLKVLAIQTASLSLGDNMIIHYLDGNLGAAHAAMLDIQTDDPLLLHYCDLIQREYQSHLNFFELLDRFSAD